VAKTKKIITQKNSSSLQTVKIHITLSELLSVQLTNCSSDVFT